MFQPQRTTQRVRDVPFGGRVTVCSPVSVGGSHIDVIRILIHKVHFVRSSPQKEFAIVKFQPQTPYKDQNQTPPDMSAASSSETGQASYASI